MFYQQQIVKNSNLHKKQIEYDNSLYEAKLKEVENDKKRIQEKVNKYKFKLIDYRKPPVCWKDRSG